MANQDRISVVNSENQYVISNIHTASGAVANTTGAIQHPAIILNDGNRVEQPIINSTYGHSTYTAIDTHQAQDSQMLRTSSESRRDGYTSLHHDHTYESIGNPHFGDAHGQKKQQKGVSRCASVIIIVLLMLILIVALVTLAIVTFTMWYLFSEVKDIKNSLGKLESRNCTTESVIQPDELMHSQVLNKLLNYIINAIYERLHYFMHIL